MNTRDNFENQRNRVDMRESRLTEEDRYEEKHRPTCLGCVSRFILATVSALIILIVISFFVSTCSGKEKNNNHANAEHKTETTTETKVGNIREHDNSYDGYTVRKKTTETSTKQENEKVKEYSDCFEVRSKTKKGRICMGMTKAEVIDILGQPDEFYCTEYSDNITYKFGQYDINRLDIRFKHGKIVSVSQH